MEQFIKHFRRISPGVWVCEEPVTFDFPDGRVQIAPGERLRQGKPFMNVDVAGRLEQHFLERGGKP
ncbi:MAG TPA: hypothetical protein VFB08_19030 [Burkholderiales bacterium]|nr:hypothetical protein [Burkholderiales bacterium]